MTLVKSLLLEIALCALIVGIAKPQATVEAPPATEASQGTEAPPPTETTAAPEETDTDAGGKDDHGIPMLPPSNGKDKAPKIGKPTKKPGKPPKPVPLPTKEPKGEKKKSTKKAKPTKEEKEGALKKAKKQATQSGAVKNGKDFDATIEKVKTLKEKIKEKLGVKESDDTAGDTIEFEENDFSGESNLLLGDFLFEGDVMLTGDQADFFLTELDGDTGATNDSMTRTKRAAIHPWYYPYQKWPSQDAIGYRIDPSITSRTVKNRIYAAISFWEQHSCIRFLRERDSRQGGYIRFVDDGTASCYSYLGYVLGPFSPLTSFQIINISPYCSTGSVMHEIAHALGMFHEQSRPDRDSYVQINWGNIHPSYVNNFIGYTASVIDTANTPYDYGSIMHYPMNAFAINPYTPTIFTRKLVPHSYFMIGQRDRPSFLDVKRMNIHYGCMGRCQHNPYQTHYQTNRIAQMPRHSACACKNGGYITPRLGNNCYYGCLCPDLLHGQFCDQLYNQGGYSATTYLNNYPSIYYNGAPGYANSHCSLNYEATSEWKTLLDVDGTCYMSIKSPKGTQLEFKILLTTHNYNALRCNAGCYGSSYVDVRFVHYSSTYYPWYNYDTSPLRMCCQTGTLHVPSAGNVIMLRKVYGSGYFNMEVQYRYRGSPSCADGNCKDAQCEIGC